MAGGTAAGSSTRLYNAGYARLFGLDTSLKNAVRKVAFDSAVHMPLVCFPVYYAYKGAPYTTVSGCKAVFEEIHTMSGG